MIATTLIVGLVGKLLAFLVLGPIVIVLLLAYIIVGKAKR